ncbi:hypothetical protein AX15_000115 [Amanita polypyramis BW_CC]|nr:hypothetical protein AX15_000115 [Amanita polypyramis BW_CC]
MISQVELQLQDYPPMITPSFISMANAAFPLWAKHWSRQRTYRPMTSKNRRNRDNFRAESKQRKAHWPSFRHTLIVIVSTISLVAVIIAYLLRPEVVSTSLFEVVELPGKGKGLVATRDIKQGELIIREKPLFIVPLQTFSSPSQLIWGLVQNLSHADQEAYMNLSYVHLPEGVDPRKQPEEVALAIFLTNAVSAGEGAGIFPRMARLNHGCAGSFNSVYSWREEEGALVVYAFKNINRGQEFLTSYMNTKQSRAQRRAYLAEHYGFECRCSICSLPDDLSRASDERLSNMVSLYARFSSWDAGEISGQEAVETANLIWKVGDEEEYWSERGRLAADVAWVAAAHSDYEATRRWATIAVQWYGYEVGPDSTLVREMQAVAIDPTGHGTWGTRKQEYVDTGRRVAS